jgi:aminopeptidase N
VLFTEYFYGKKAADEYVIGLRKNISNDIPIIGDYGVNKEGSGDMYDKGANMIHTIRQIINNDKKFRAVLRGLSKEFYHQTVSTSQIEQYISNKSGIDFSPVFNQYLRTTAIPNFSYEIKSGKLFYKWTNVDTSFNMPVKISIGKKKEKWLYPTTNIQSIPLKISENGIKLNSSFYVTTTNDIPQ